MSDLQREIAELRRENARLRKLLKLTDAEAAAPQGTQGAWFDKAPGSIDVHAPPDAKLAFYAALFSARRDVYAVRWESRRNGTTVFLDLATLEPCEDQWEHLSTLDRLTPKDVEKLARQLREPDLGPRVSRPHRANSTRTQRTYAGTPVGTGPFYGPAVRDSDFNGQQASAWTIVLTYDATGGADGLATAHVISRYE